MNAVFGAVLAQWASEPTPLWRVLLYSAIAATVLLAGYLIWLFNRRPSGARLWALLGVVIVLSLWGGYRLESNNRWRVNSLTNDAIALFDLADDSYLYKSNLHSEGPCEYRQVNQIATLIGVIKPPDSGSGRGSIESSTFVLAESVANELQEDGWSVRRFELLNRPASLVIGSLGLSAHRGDSYLMLTIENGGSVGVKTFTAECFAEHFNFWRNRTSWSMPVDEFVP